ncbi:ATPase, H+ transporting, lysosomal accessory protein 1b [Silurus asotus]|uniref:ATPase, H+ transporting, lysosomal accessory protein 1b n=1 Tax=Silurus asotus TaxID=30991 RepID=A0AAD5A423_SILAS|nr:ATPase, H+ transporting, lysosomal accessory protein 1b [Silurus asotus]
MAKFIVLFLFSLLCACRGQVPLIMWTSDGYTLPTLEEPTAGEIVSGAKFESYLKSALTTSPHTVLLFLQDELSMDDFTAYGGVYGNKKDSVFVNLESALQASTPKVLPSLDWTAAELVEEIFQQQLGVPALSVVPSELNQLHLNTAEPSLLLIRLPYTTGAQSKELLRKNDETIGNVLTILQAQSVPYTAVYTGLKPSHVIQDETSMVSGLAGRSLLQAPLQADGKPPVAFNNTEGKPCILLWADQLKLSYDKGNVFDLALLTFNGSATLEGSFCNASVARLVLNYKNVLNFRSLQLIFSMRNSFFPVSARFWSVMEQVVLNYDGQTAIFNGSHDIYNPAEYSFHCQEVSTARNPLLVPRSKDDSATRWTVLFTDFQIQGFNVTGAFSYANDCASFFTPGIWMGLLTALLMVFILTYGLHMIMQLRTMDRFDDPKGPSISVPQNE